jgi:hypothetical protein
MSPSPFHFVLPCMYGLQYLRHVWQSLLSMQKRWLRIAVLPVPQLLPADICNNLCHRFSRFEHSYSYHSYQISHRRC